LLHWPQWHEPPEDHQPGLFVELAPRPFERILTSVDLTFRDGPRPEVFALPVGTAWMNEEDLPTVVPPSVEQDPCALLRARKTITG
jgi:hypothetical protein